MSTLATPPAGTLPPADPAHSPQFPDFSHSPHSLQLPDEVQAIFHTAQRRVTPCTGGIVVWHVWQPLVPQPKLSPVVLFHGGSGSWTHWFCNIAALLASGRQVYVPDLPGFGDSSTPSEGLDADALPVPLEEGLQILLGNQACDLVGFSFGGLTAGLFTVQFPARVARLVVVGAPGLGLSLAVRLRSWRHLPDAKAREAIHRSNLAALMVHSQEAITETAVQVHTANLLRDRMPGRKLARTDALLKALRNVSCPIHAIYGSEDALYPGGMAGVESLLRQAPAFRGMTVVPDAGHWVQFEQANLFDVVLLGILKG